MSRFFLPPLLALVLAVPALAQDTGLYIYSSYFECDPASLAAVDAFRASTAHPALDAHVAAGEILGWGWMTHHTGGRWNRATYVTAPTLEALMAFQNARQAEARASTAGPTALQTACRVHEDYIWRQVVSSLASGAAGTRTETAGSTYFRCTQGGLDRADAIVRESFAPILNGLVSEGLITAWRWHAHVMGGAFTRILVIDAASHLDVLRAIEAYSDRIETQARAAGTEFNEACPSHQDYLWTVRASR